MQGKVLLRGKPVQGAVIAVGGWVNPTPTDANGMFGYPADDTLARRNVARVVDASHATVGGSPVSADDQKALVGKGTGISVGYKIDGIKTHVQGGNVVVTGKLSDSSGNAPPTVLLYTYKLSGKITDANGNPVKGAIVVTRTGDRKFWTQSAPSGANGQYASFLVSADQEEDDPVPMQVGIAVGDTAYAEPAADLLNFKRLSSASLDVQLPGGGSTTLPKSILNPQPIPGAFYQGLLIGVVSGDGKVVTPVKATWPDASGKFTLVLPGSARGQTVVFWESDRQFYSTQSATPGGPVDPAIYPKRLPSDAPQGLATVKLP
jgi:hypothetical protein